MLISLFCFICLRLICKLLKVKYNLALKDFFKKPKCWNAPWIINSTNPCGIPTVKTNKQRLFKSSQWTAKCDLTVKIQNQGQTHSEIWSKGGCSVQFHTVKPFTWSVNCLPCKHVSSVCCWAFFPPQFWVLLIRCPGSSLTTALTTSSSIKGYLCQS